MLCQKIKLSKTDKKRQSIAVAFYNVLAKGGDLNNLQKETGVSLKTLKRHLDKLNLSTAELGGRQRQISEEEFKAAYNEVAKTGGYTSDLATKLNISPYKVKRYYIEYGLKPLLKKRGGSREGAGRKEKSIEEQLLDKQQEIDECSNSRAVGIFKYHRLKTEESAKTPKKGKIGPDDDLFHQALLNQQRMDSRVNSREVGILETSRLTQEGYFQLTRQGRPRTDK